MFRNEHCQLVLKGNAIKDLEKYSISINESVQYEIKLMKFERVKF